MPSRRLTTVLASETLVIVIGAAYVLILLAFLPAQVAPDTWLALVGGRSVAHSGLPGDDVLTVWTHGVAWIDQQWLGQLVFYGLQSLGGVKLLLLVHAVSAGTAFALALTFARRRGASQRMVARIGILALGSLVIVSTTARTQSFAYPLFVGVLWLVAADSRQPTRRVLWVAPLLAVWANLHGSVVIGAGIVVLSGAIFVVRGARSDAVARREALHHGALLIAIGLLSLLVSPYVLSLGDYYSSVLFNGEFGTIVTEWMSPRPSVATAAFYLLGGIALWSIGRSGAQLTPLERVVLVVTLASGFTAIRNIIWFALAATMLVPVAIERATRQRQTRSAPLWFEAGLSSLAMLAVLAVGISFVLGSANGYDVKYPPRAAEAVSRAAQRDPTATIFAEATYADWLLWRYPSLSGRILFDVRFELLTRRQLHDIVRFYRQLGPRWEDGAGDARILVLNRTRRPLPEMASASELLEREGVFRRVATAQDVVVLTRSAGGRPRP